jgi:hypothetical protein
MPLDSTSTYEQTPPRRPALDDLNGGNLQNRADFPPTPYEHPDARAMNQSDRQLVALAAISAAVGLHVTFPGGTPTIQVVMGVRTDLEAADFTITDHGNGDTTIVHTGGMLPVKTLPVHSLTQADDTEIDRIRAVPVTNGVRVKTKLGATGTDAAFVLWLTGVG